MAEREPKSNLAKDNRGRPNTLAVPLPVYNTMASCLDVSPSGNQFQFEKAPKHSPNAPDNRGSLNTLAVPRPVYGMARCLDVSPSGNQFQFERTPKHSPNAPEIGSPKPKPSPPRNEPPPGFRRIPSIIITPASPVSSASSAMPKTPDGFLRSPSNPADRHEYLRRHVCALMEEFSKAKKWEWSILTLVESIFEGNNLLIFLDILFRQVLCDTPFASDQRVAATLVRTLIVRGVIAEAKVMELISNGIIKDLGNLLVLPQGVSDFAGFLTDLFLPEPDLKWLLTLTNNVPLPSPVSTELIHFVIESLKQRISVREVHKRVRRTLDLGWK